MKRAYEDDRDIIDHVADVEDADVCFYPAESGLAHRFLASLRGGSFVQRERPDFEDTVAMLLLEAMVVDDHPRPGRKDRTRMRESEVIRELETSGLDVHPDAKVIASVSSGLPTDKDHNYRAYADHFTRTVLKHARNSEVYRAERPGYELGFIVFDESTAYIEGMGEGDVVTGRPHAWFADSAFVDAIQRSEADCFVWVTPYKRLETDAGVIPLPAMTIIDVALLNKSEHFVYDAGRMVSSDR
ncbi:hypothetical protein [Microbacterium resistens]|uniref:hypothetical protein n=1 Tax=Microbacterium resistens TaxID=156977 RepID=UPI000833962F|nr:hypothetical protein [Microbacterium resistens]